MPENYPHVAIIGAAKSGTTSLAKLLGKHPKICLGKRKEPEFFSHDENFNRGYSAYLENFSHSVPGQLTLDASTGYTRSPQHPNTARRLFDAAPDAKLVYLLRHPVDRAYSHYVHRFTKECHPGKPIDQSFEDFVKLDPMCVDSSDYRLQIQSYLDFFPRESLLLLFTEDLERSEGSVLEEVCRFVGVQYDEGIFADMQRNNVTSNFLKSRVRIQVTNRLKRIPGMQLLIKAMPRGPKEMIFGLLRRTSAFQAIERQFTPPPLRPEIRAELLHRYRDMTQWLEAFTGRSLDAWYK